MSNPETIREEKLKTTKSLLIDMSKKIDRVYNKLMIALIFVGQNVEEGGYWDIYEKMESVRKEIKDALNELDATLDELKYVNAPSLDETAEINTEIKDEKQLIGNVYDVFNELATIYDKDVLFILTYTLEAKFFDIYSKIEYSIRRALWNAIMLLADIIYNFSTR